MKITEARQIYGNQIKAHMNKENLQTLERFSN